jgi:hypothetical protein
MFWIAFAADLFVGAFLGFILLAILIVARDTDDEIERQEANSLLAHSRRGR